MGLDVYVGTLTRYRAADWQTSVVAAGLALGYRVNILRRKADGTTEIVDARDIRPAPPAEQLKIREEVERWRRDMSRAFPQAPLDWQESSGQPYFTDKPDWYGYGAMLVLAAHEERRPPGKDVTYPERLDFDHWREDPLLQEVRKSSRSQFDQLFEAEVWLPGGPDDVTFATALPWSKKVVGFGAMGLLLSQLEDLNNRTFRGTEQDLALWRNDERVGGDDPSHPFEPNAKFGLSIFLTLARKAVEHGLPMLLDY